MGRKPNIQIRIGTREKKLIEALVSRISKYRIFGDMKNQRETRFNDRLMDFLRQEPKPLDVSNRSIPTPVLFGEQFRPEFYLKNGSSKLLCAVECKRLTDKRAKSTWKAGLSQALLYSTVYKYVVLVFFDFTKDCKFAQCVGPGNREETKFAKELRKKSNIRIVFIASELR